MSFSSLFSPRGRFADWRLATQSIIGFWAFYLVTVLLRGWAEREDVLRALARATALVFPSVWPEPLSRVLLEALALGTPVAAMDTGGTREILVDEESGLVVSQAAELGPAVARLIGDSALRSRIAEGARERARVQAS